MSAHPTAATAAAATTTPADDATPLTALCGVCHVSAPRYRCPRCAARTCSLACVTKHKSRAGCSGARDPAAFVPASRLRTPAGIDHDYNFLSAIERARDRAARDVAGRTGIAPPVDAPDEVPPDQANGGGNHSRRGGGGGRGGRGRGGRGGGGGGSGAASGAKEQQVRFRKIWRGDELIHVPIDPASWGRQRQQMDHMGDYRQAGGAEPTTEEQQPKEDEDEDKEMPDVDGAAPPRQQQPEQEYGRISWFPQAMGKAEKAKCRDLDIEVIAAPTGLARQRENKTAWYKRGKGIKWTVEWLVYDLVDKEESGHAESDTSSDTSSSDNSSSSESDSESESGPGRDTTAGLGSDRRKMLSAKPTRIVHTASDTEPLYRCFANTMNWVRRGQEKEGAAAVQQEQRAQGLIEDAADGEGGDDANLSQMKKKRKKARIEARAGQQDGSGAGTWPASAYPAQNPFTGCWETEDLGAATSCSGWEADEDLDRRRKGFRYYLLRPATGPPPRRLIPIRPDGTLTEALHGRTVLEYPTVYVIPIDRGASGSSPPLLPRGHAEAPAGDRRPPRPPPPVKQEPEQEVTNGGRGWGKNAGRRGGREQSGGGKAGMATGRGGLQGSYNNNNNNNPRDRKRKPSEQHRQQRAPEKKIRVEEGPDDDAAAMEDGEVGDGDGGGAALAAVAAAVALDQAVDARVVRAALLKAEETQGAAPGGLVAYESDSE
ncbi:hypothetical protein RB597_010065 [Gaeumannomyces tritici]